MIAAVINLEVVSEGVIVDSDGSPLSHGITLPNLQWRIHHHNGHLRIGAGI
jgi:hypothetical protein